MDPQKYAHPTLVNPPFRDELIARLSRVVGEGAESVLDRLIPLLDGSRSVADIYGRLIAQDISTDIITKTLDELDGMGCLADLTTTVDGPVGTKETARYHAQIACLEEWLMVRQNPEEVRTGGIRAQSLLADARVIVMGLGRTGSTLIEALASAGIGQIFGIRSEGEGTVEEESAGQLPARVLSLNSPVRYVEITSVEHVELGDLDKKIELPLLVYCPDDFREEVCKQLNTLSLTMGSSLLVYRESPFSVDLGPLIIPKKTACYVCYELRRKAAEPSSGPDETPPPGSPALSFSCGAHLLALEVVKILTRAAFPVTQGKLWRLGLFDGMASVHPVLKLPRCPACGVQRMTPPRRIWEE